MFTLIHCVELKMIASAFCKGCIFLQEEAVPELLAWKNGRQTDHVELLPPERWRCQLFTFNCPKEHLVTVEKNVIIPPPRTPRITGI